MTGARLPVLACIAIALAGLIALELTTGEEPPPEAAPLAASPVPAPPPPADDVPLHVAALLARPVFAPDRRPELVQGGIDPGLPRLTGILVTNGSRRAIFAGTNGARSAVLAEGETIGAYKVQAITPADVTLSGTDGLHRLHPTYSAASPAGAAPGQAPVFQTPVFQTPEPQVFKLPPPPAPPGTPTPGPVAMAPPPGSPQ